jgi:hypothetical protein
MNFFKISKQLSKNQFIISSCMQPGFLLIELMVALMLCIFFIYLMYCYQGMCIEVRYETIKRYEVTNLIHSFLAKASINPALLNQENYKENDCTLTWKIQDFHCKKPEFLKEISSKTQCIQVTAQWFGLNKKNHTMIVAGGIVV